MFKLLSAITFLVKLLSLRKLIQFYDGSNAHSLLSQSPRLSNECAFVCVSLSNFTMGQMHIHCLALVTGSHLGCIRLAVTTFFTPLHTIECQSLAWGCCCLPPTWEDRNFAYHQ